MNVRLGHLQSKEACYDYGVGGLMAYGSSARSSERGSYYIASVPFTVRRESQSLIGESLGRLGSRQVRERVLRDETRCINVTTVTPHKMSGERGRAVLANDVGTPADT